MKEQLNLGIIGMSEGNGYPYSWSAIFNGYNSLVMKDCPFPGIYQYLAQRIFPDDAIQGAKVTHIWTQDEKISRHIADATYIENIVENFEDLIGKVDGVLLARDDSENHRLFSQPFLESGIPIYIDKPLALTVQDAKSLFALAQNSNQLFTCSALRYASELYLGDDIGELKSISASVGKSWEKFAIHIVEPVLSQLDSELSINEVYQTRCGNTVTVSVIWDNGLQTSFTTLGDVVAPININFYGTKGYSQLHFSDSFSAFKSALSHFICMIRKEKKNISQELVLKNIKILELGLR